MPRIGRLQRAACGDSPDLPLARKRRLDLSGPQRSGRAGAIRSAARTAPTASGRRGDRGRAGRSRARQGDHRAGPAAPAPELTPTSWRDEAGQLITDQEGASIHGDFGIPARATIEFEVSWKKKPDFVFALGTSDQPDSVKRAFRFEAWGGDLIVQRELEKEADLAVVQEIGPGPGRAHFQVYLDQENNRITIFSQLGKQLASLKVGSSKSPAHSGVDLTNLRGDLRLEWLRIVRWSGEPPREVKADQARIHRADGSIVYGKVTRFDAASREFVDQVGDRRKRGLAPTRSRACSCRFPGKKNPGRFASSIKTASRFSGDLQKIEKGVAGAQGRRASPKASAAAQGPSLAGGFDRSRPDAPVEGRIDRPARDPRRAAHAASWSTAARSRARPAWRGSRSRARPPARSRRASRARSSTRSRRPLPRRQQVTQQQQSASSDSSS